MARSTVAVAFTGNASQLKSAIADVDGKMGGLGSTIGSAAKIAAAGMAAAGAAVIGFAAKSADTFAKVGGEVNKLVRYTGETAEEASRLRFAGTQAGIGVDTMTKSLGLLSKGMSGTKFDKLGFDFKTASGAARPLNDDLLQIATRFQGMENGPAKTALAMQLFGRAGADMIPFLNRGADGIRELEAQSDKYGETLSGKDLQAVKDSTANHRLFTAAMEGLQIQVGRYVLPIITQFTTFMATHLPAAIETTRKIMERLKPTFDSVARVLDTAFSTGARVLKDDLIPALSLVAGWLDRNKPVLEAVAILVGTTLVTAFVSWGVSATVAAAQAVAAFIATQAQSLISAGAMLIDIGLVIAGWVASGVAAAASGAAMAAAWIAATGPIGLLVAAVVGAALLIVTHFDTVRDAIVAVFNWVKDNWPLILEILTGPIGLAVRTISQHWQGIKDGFTAVKTWIGDRVGDIVGFITGMPGRISRAASGMWDGIKEAFKAAINWIIRGWNRLEFKLPSVDTHIPGVGKIGGWTLGTPDIPTLALGGNILSAGTVMVGENGPEFLNLPVGAQVRPLSAGPGAGLTLNIAIDARGAIGLNPAEIVGYLRHELADIALRNGLLAVR